MHRMFLFFNFILLSMAGWLSFLLSFLEDKQKQKQDIILSKVIYICLTVQMNNHNDDRNVE